MVAFTITEINFSGKPILQCDVTPFLFISVVLSSFGCAIGLVFSIVTKAALASRNLLPNFSRSPSGQVLFKQMFSLNSILQIVMVMVLL